MPQDELPAVAAWPTATVTALNFGPGMGARVERPRTPTTEDLVATYPVIGGGEASAPHAGRLAQARATTIQRLRLPRPHVAPAFPRRFR